VKPIIGFCLPLATTAGLAAESQDFMTRDTLTGDWFGARDTLARHGVVIDLSWTEFYQGTQSGDGYDDFEFGGRADALIHFDTGKLGLWEGGGFHTHIESRFGDAPGSRGGALWPVNTGLVLPVGEYESVVASSLYFSQKAGDFSMMLGKINAVDLVANDPFYGGWGNTRFMNVAFVAPPSGLLPPVIMGGVFNYRLKPFSFTFMAYDPDDQTSEYGVDQLFDDGVVLALSGTWSGEWAGRATSFTLGGKYDTGDGADLSEVLLPPDLKSGTKDGAFSVSLDFSHLIYESPEQEGEGLGIYLKTAIADGNPNVIQGSVGTGLAGHGIVPGRPLDVFGLGYFYYDFSDDLQDATSPLVEFDDEQGVELFYNFAVTPWFRISADLQWINPATGANDDALVGALRTQIVF
jgi:porin